METPTSAEIQSPELMQSYEEESQTITSQVDELSQEVLTEDSDIVELVPSQQDISSSVKVLSKIVRYLEMHEIVARIFPLSKGVHAYFKK